MKFVRYFFQVIIGVLFGALAALALSPFFASFAEGSGVPYLILAAVIIAVIIALASNIRRCFGRSFLFLGAAIFALPLSTLVLSGAAMNETVSAASEADKGFAVAGGVLAGGLLTGAAAFVGFFAGSIFLIAGLIMSLGGIREVVITREDKR
jgi:hypothetical protein